MSIDIVKVSEQMNVGAALGVHEPVKWRAHLQIKKYWGDITPEYVDQHPELQPYEVVEIENNLLVTVGATLLWNLLIGAGGTVFSNANAYLGVGDSTTAAASGQTDLQAATNKVRVAMDATYPSVSGASITFRSTFGSAVGNFTWEEWGLFNASSSGTMLNRKVQSMGTKVSGATWIATATLTLS